MSYDGIGPLRPRRRPFTPARSRRRGLPVLLSILLLAGLAGLAFLQAWLLSPLLFRSVAEEGREVLEVNLPEREVRVLVSILPDGPDLLLKTLLDLPEADGEQAARLDRLLFPDDGLHAYRLLVVHNRGEGDLPLDLDPGRVRLTGSDGEVWAAADLTAALRERSGAIPDPLLAWLRLRIPGEDIPVVRPGGTRRFLFAFPAEATPGKVRSGSVAGIPLDVETITKDELDRRLEAREDDGT